MEFIKKLKDFFIGKIDPDTPSKLKFEYSEYGNKEWVIPMFFLKWRWIPLLSYHEPIFNGWIKEDVEIINLEERISSEYLKGYYNRFDTVGKCLKHNSDIRKKVKELNEKYRVDRIERKRKQTEKFNELNRK